MVWRLAWSFPGLFVAPKARRPAGSSRRPGAIAAIGRLDHAGALLDGTAGTAVVPAI